MFYQNLKRLCDERHTTPSAVVREIGLSNSTATSWKKNHSIPKQETLDKLAKILDCNISDFFKTDRERIEYSIVNLDDSSSKSPVTLDDNIKDFIFIYESCSNRQRNQLMSMVYDFEQKVLNP